MPVMSVYHRKVTFCYFVKNCLKQKWKSFNYALIQQTFVGSQLCVCTENKYGIYLTGYSHIL